MMEDSQNSEENIKIEKEDTCEESVDIDCDNIETEEMKFDLDTKEIVDLNLISQNGVSTSCAKHISVANKPTCKVEIDCDESSVEEQCQNIAVNDNLNSFVIKANSNSLEENIVNDYDYSETARPKANFEIEQVFIKEELCDTDIKDIFIGSDLEEIELNKIISDSKDSGMENSQLETAQNCNKLSEEEAISLFPNEASTTDSNEANPPSLAAKFNINRSAIESVPKENQATELRSIEGLSVYDQSTLEAGILLQVDQALEKEASDETEMERQIRQGEITPFGTSLGETLSSGAAKTTDGLSVIEKYLSAQLELQGKRKRKMESNRNSSGKQQQPLVKFANKEAKRNSQKSKIFNIHSKKKRRKKDTIGSVTQDCVPRSVRPDPMPGEQASMAPDDASDSEYLPSDSDYIPSSEDEKRDNKLKEKRDKPQANRNKRKLPYTKPYKIPEDWATDDSDWEYSDEEGNLKKNKRSKKELDDGDVDIFNRRIRVWKQERKEAGVNKDSQLYHKLNEDFKVPQDMWDKLYNYQRVGVQWLWELDQQMCGGILGDEMGLGKTIQIVAFLAGLHVSDLKDKDTNYRGLGPTLIVCPTTVMHQWVREFHEWYPPIRVAILHESGTFCGKQRSRLIGNIVQAGGVLITSYTGATQHKDDIISRRWHYVVLDEGHKIRNPDAQITLMVKQLQTTHRIVLSGSPMQNNLKELWSLFDFVFPGKLGTLPVFLEQFAVPITQGGYANASQVQVMTAFKCATVLKDTMAPYLLRRMKADVKSHIKLPEKNEQVLFCRLTDEQRHYYKDYVESGEVSRILDGRLKIFVGLINLRKICNHPDLYIGPKPGETEDDLPEAERFGHWSKSGKMIVVETLLKLWHKQGHRVLVFTQSRQMLSIMESFVRQSGYKYLKLDGTTSIAARQPLINNFNQDTSYFLMLLTTRVGGLGVNLTGANRVLIYDPDWNPATDTQARERAWRIGQRQSVTVYRLITAGTIEEKMYHRQIFKQFLCNKVLKDPSQRRFFKSNDLYELFALKETDIEGSTETGAIFAGTGSEVKLDPTKTYKHCKIDPKLSAEPPPKTFSRKTAEKKRMMEQKLKEKSEKMESTSKGEVNFSNEKIEHMKKLAQMLSQKIVQTSLPEKNNSKDQIESSENVVLIDNEISNNNLELSIPTSTDNGDCSPETSRSLETPKSKNILKKISGCDTSLDKSNVSSPSSSNSSASLIKSVKNKTHKHKSKHKDKKKKRGKDANFEGETVPHLVRTGESTSLPSADKDNSEKYATQDEYVLHKLFARSGLQTALKHDTIMEGGPADYALVEVEADRVAQQAVEKLKESRRECWQASSGIPNFTGQSGARNFQLQKRPGKTKSSVAEWSSSAILEQIRKRNCAREVKDPEIILVQDIREFVSSQGGTVHTTQLIDRFEGRLPEGSSPLFKSLLAKICTFYRAPDKLGYWTLKEEFNW